MRDISRRYGVSKDALSRRAEECSPQTLAEEARERELVGALLTQVRAVQGMVIRTPRKVPEVLRPRRLLSAGALAAVHRGTPRMEVAQTFGASSATTKRRSKGRREAGGFCPR